MTEKEIKTEIKKELQQGVLKSDLYDQLKNSYDDEKLRLLLAAKPSCKNRMKFKVIHIILSIIWGIFVLIELLNIIDLINSFDLKIIISSVIAIYLTIHIWKFDGRFLLPGIIWFIFTIYNTFRQLVALPDFEPDYSIIQSISIGYSIMLLVGIYLMYYLRKNVFDYYKWFKPDKNYKNESMFQQITPLADARLQSMPLEIHNKKKHN